MNTYESLKFCDGAQNKQDVQGWETLHEFGIMHIGANLI